MKQLVLSVCVFALLGTPIAQAAIAVSGEMSRQAANLALEACGLPTLDDKAEMTSPLLKDISDIGVVQSFNRIAKHCDPTLELPEIDPELGTLAGFDGSTYARIVSTFKACGIKPEERQAGGGYAIFDVYTLKAALRLERYCWDEHTKKLQQ